MCMGVQMARPSTQAVGFRRSLTLDWSEPHRLDHRKNQNWYAGRAFNQKKAMSSAFCEQALLPEAIARQVASFDEDG